MTNEEPGAEEFAKHFLDFMNSKDERELEMIEVGVNAYANASSPEEAFQILQFGTGTTPEKAIRNVVWNSPGPVAKAVLEDLILVFLDENRIDIVVEVLESISRTFVAFLEATAESGEAGPDPEQNDEHS